MELGDQLRSLKTRCPPPDSRLAEWKISLLIRMKGFL